MNSRFSCLLVEDDPDDREFFLDTFYDVLPDARCYAVADGQEALYALLHDDLMPDFMFIDLHLPKMSGLELLETLKRIDDYRTIPVVIYTNDCSDEHINAAKSLGALGIYSKARPSALEMILRKYLAPLQTNQRYILRK